MLQCFQLINFAGVGSHIVLDHTRAAAGKAVTAGGLVDHSSLEAVVDNCHTYGQNMT